MRVDKVSLLNIDDLYTAVVNKQQDKDYHDKPFGFNLSQFLSHMTIMVDLSEVSEYEYIFLKNYIRTVSPFKRDMNNNYVENQFEGIYKSSCEPLFQTLRPLVEGNTNVSIDSLLPLGFITGRTTVSLSGDGITLITGIDPTIFFLRYKATLNVVEQPARENALDIEMVNMLTSNSFIDYLISIFINNFYKFMLDKIMIVDPVSEAFNHSMYLDTIKKSACILSVQSYDFLINFNQSGVESILSVLDKYREDNNEMSLLERLRYVNIEFGLHTSMEVFFYLFNLLPYEKFNSIESFIITNERSMKEPPVIPSFATTYEKRITSRIKSLKDDIEKVYSDNSNLMKKFMLTFGYTKIKYTINISLLDYLIYLEGMDILQFDEKSQEALTFINTWCKAIKDKIIR